MSESRDLSDVLDAGLMPIYTMTNFFLGTIIQPKYFTDLSATGTWEEFVEYYIPEHWEELVVYGIGFVVCAAIGVVLCLGMIFAALFVCCCRCCGNCSGKKKKKRSHKKCEICLILRYILLGLTTVALLLATIPLFFFSDDIYQQISNVVYSDTELAMNTTVKFLDQSVDDLNQTVYVSFLDAEHHVMKTLYDIPADAAVNIDNATGVTTAMNQLEQFTLNMPRLNNSLNTANYLVSDLTTRTKELDVELQNSKSIILSVLNHYGEYSEIAADVDSIHVAVNFTVINLTNAIIAVEQSLNDNLTSLVNNSIDSLTSAFDDINNTISPGLDEVNSQLKQAETAIADGIHSIDDGVKSINLTNVNKALQDAEEFMVVPSNIIYLILIILSVVLLLIAVFNVIGLILGILLPAKTKDGCCRGDKSIAAFPLLTGTSLSFIFYWLYAIVVCACFLAGGISYTEVCRNVINFNDPKSFAVLSVFDGWIQNVTDKTYLAVFDSYRKCSYNMSAYLALNLDQEYNLSKFTGEEIVQEMNKIKTLMIDIPPVHIISIQMNSLLNTLDSAFNENALNFSYFYNSINGNIVEPNITEIVNKLLNLSNLNTTDNDTIVNQAVRLINISTIWLPPIETDRDNLTVELNEIENMVGDISFSEIATTLNYSESFINDNADNMTSAFLNGTVDELSDYVVSYCEDVLWKVENEVARCGQLYDSITVMVDTTCVKTLYPFNGFWFCIGCCLVLLFISIIVSLKLSNRFRQKEMTKSKKKYQETKSQNKDVIHIEIDDPPPDY